MVRLKVLQVNLLKKIKLIGEKTMVVISLANDNGSMIGSYFAVNQNAINLVSNKIIVKGSMIVDGTTDDTTQEN